MRTLGGIMVGLGLALGAKLVQRAMVDRRWDHQASAVACRHESVAGV